MKRRAIVLEDDDLLRKMLVHILRLRGYEVFAFSSPALCPLYIGDVDSCSRGEACSDIIISDLCMPMVNGLEFVEDRKMKGCLVTNIALTSGAWEADMIERAEELGCRIMQKPFQIEELYSWLDECEARISPDRRLREWPIEEVKAS